MGHDRKINRPDYKREKKAALEKVGLSKLCEVRKHTILYRHVVTYEYAANEGTPDTTSQ